MHEAVADRHGDWKQPESRSISSSASARVCVRACVRVRACACVCACARACVCVCASNQRCALILTLISLASKLTPLRSIHTSFLHKTFLLSIQVRFNTPGLNASMRRAETVY